MPIEHPKKPPTPDDIEKRAAIEKERKLRLESIEAAAKKRKAEKEAAIEKASELLAAKGILINVGGCGCCGSPTMHLEIDGEVILDDQENVNFNNFEE